MLSKRLANPVVISSLLVIVRAANSAEPSPATAVDAYVAPLIARGDLSGQLLVLRDGQIILERSFGFANADSGTPVTPTTIFNIASVTKPMTFVVAVQLIQEGKLAVGDSLAKWFPDFPAADSITVGMLLQHRSGIHHEVVPDSEMTRPFTAAEVVERAARLPLDFPPGSQSRYSSGGFEVLARILELAGGASYGELLSARIFGPLGMTRSGHLDSRTIRPNQSTARVPGAHGMENAPFQDFSALVGAGSVWSNAADLHRFVAAIVDGKLGKGPQLSYVRNGHLDFNGRTGGFKAWAVWDSTSGVEAIFAGNVATGAPDALKRDIIDLVTGKDVTSPKLPVLADHGLPADELARFPGVYQIENGPRLELRVKDGALYSNDWVLQPTRDGAFFSPRDYGLVRGVPGPDGRITRLDWIQGDQTYPAPRVGD